MDIDFSSLAARIAADIQDLRGCVIVSRDGLVLGSHPADAENILRPAWLRFASLGDVEKGFIQFSGELWVYVRRGPYASFAVSNSVSRPGLLLDELEHVLLAAEEARAMQDTGMAGGGEAPRSKPRTSLHPEAKPPTPAPAPATAIPAPSAEVVASDPPPVVEVPPPTDPYSQYAPPGAPAEAPIVPPATPATAPPSAPQPSEPAPAEGQPVLPVPPLPVPASEGSAPTPQGGPSQDDSLEVDRIALAQEFAQLLGESGYDDEESEP